MRRFAIASLIVLSLAACGEKKADPAAKAAGGEVLEGTISDAMVDLDRSTAQAPIAPGKGGEDKDEGAAKDPAKASAAAEDEAPAPAASPSEKKSAAPAAEDE